MQTPAMGDSGSGLDFKRRATVGLLGNFGEVHLGRDETAAYKAMQRYDVLQPRRHRRHAILGAGQQR